MQVHWTLMTVGGYSALASILYTVDGSLKWRKSSYLQIAESPNKKISNTKKGQYDQVQIKIFQHILQSALSVLFFYSINGVGH